MLFYVYMLKTASTKFIKTYVGYRNDIAKRLAKHNTNKGAKSTKGHKWILIFKKTTSYIGINYVKYCLPFAKLTSIHSFVNL